MVSNHVKTLQWQEAARPLLVRQSSIRLLSRMFTLKQETFIASTCLRVIHDNSHN